MHSYTVTKSQLAGTIFIPSSKSQTLRAILFGALGKGQTTIHHPLNSADTHSMIKACQLMGASMTFHPQQIAIQGLGGRIEQTEDVIDAGNSGIILRFCTAVGALAKKPIVITGDYSIRHQRPMQPLIAGLTQLGVRIEAMRGDQYAPLIIKGPILGEAATITGEDSQPVSALLIAAAFAQQPIALTVKNAGEKPWVALTLSWFERLGIAYENHSFAHYTIKGNSSYEGFEYTVPGDFSSAAFPLAAALITQSALAIHNINIRDAQGDKELIEVVKQMGAQIEYDELQQVLHIKKTPYLKGITVDLNNLIDALPILAVIACFAEGETVIYNAAVAKQKECNRLHCITLELQKMGADIRETDEGVIVRGSTLKAACVHSHGDHRMAMALTVAALATPGTSIIEGIECVAKTFPTFKRNFNQLGANITAA